LTGRYIHCVTRFGARPKKSSKFYIFRNILKQLLKINELAMKFRAPRAPNQLNIDDERMILKDLQPSRNGLQRLYWYLRRLGARHILFILNDLRGYPLCC
jgi:hypothetical protein